jgi:hypothetical protein
MKINKTRKLPSNKYPYNIPTAQRVDTCKAMAKVHIELCVLNLRMKHLAL